MTEIRFDNLVNKYFKFLVKKHGYKINIIDPSNYPDPSTEDGEAEIVSKKTLIYVMKSRGDYDLRIGPYGEPKFTRMFPLIILELSGAPFDFDNFPRRENLSKFEWFLMLHEHLLNKEEFHPFLGGDFSQWLNILEADIKKFKEDYFRDMNKELPPNYFRDLENYIYMKRMQKQYP